MKTLTTIFSSLLIALSLPLAAQNNEGSGDDFSRFFNNAISQQKQQKQTAPQQPDTLAQPERPARGSVLEGLLGRTRRPGRKQIEQENELLRSELDSLQMLVDSLRGREYLDEYEIAVLEGNDPNPVTFEYNQETSDSLLHLWYKNSLVTDFDAVTAVAAENGAIRPEDVARLLHFRDDPSDESWIAGVR